MSSKAPYVIQPPMLNAEHVADAVVAQISETVDPGATAIATARQRRRTPPPTAVTPQASAPVAAQEARAAESTLPTNHDIPLNPSGLNRDTFFAKLMRSYTKDSSVLINRDSERVLQTWLRDMLVEHASVEDVILDLSTALEESGAPIDMDMKDIKAFLQELVWLKASKSLIDKLGLEDYADTILLRDIEKAFGRAPDPDGERSALAATKASALAEATLQALQHIGSLLTKAPVAPVDVRESAFGRSHSRPSVPARPASRPPTAPPHA